MKRTYSVIIKSTLTFPLLIFIISILFSTVLATDDLDNSFTPSVTRQDFTGYEYYGKVSDISVQSDNKILIGGDFQKVNGVAHHLIARLNADGTLDNSFNAPSNLIGVVHDICIQADGKILIGGSMRYDTENILRPIQRLNADGSLDPEFIAPSFGAVGDIYTVEADAIGKIYIGGIIFKINGTDRSRLARLNQDGSLDTNFTIEFPQYNAIVNKVAIQPNGKIMIGGNQLGNFNPSPLIRIDPVNNQIDNSFILNRNNNSFTVPDEFASFPGINTFVLSPNLGKIIISACSYTGTCFIARYNSDGAFDTGFNTLTTDTVNTILIEPSGKILIGGAYRSQLLRLQENGLVDESFNTNITDGYQILSFAKQLDGKVLIGGEFNKINNFSHRSLARINGETVPAALSKNTKFDFDGDGRADFSVFNSESGNWKRLDSRSGYFTARFGVSDDKLAPADFDGDGRADIAVFRNGIWYWLASSNGGFNAFQFGQAGDLPVPADYTGDGRAELAVYRGGVWYMLNLVNNQFQGVQFGLPTDKPISADYDGDGKTDLAVYRDGIWYLLRSKDGFSAVRFGIASDKIIAADFDGDGRADQAVFRDGLWFLNRSTTGFLGLQFGIATDIPISADYDGDGKADIAVYREGVWYMLQSSGNNQFRAVQFGVANDKPIPAVFLP